MKNTTELKDTYFAVQHGMADRIMRDPMSRFLRPGTDIGSRSYGFISIEFQGAGTSCDLTIEADMEYDWRRTDADGNEWNRFNLACKVNHPTHGSSDPATLMARCELYRQVALLGASLMAEFGGRQLLQMTRTKAEVIADQAERDAKANDDLARRFIDTHRGRMPVGPAKLVRDAGGIKHGSYTHVFSTGTSKREYLMFVDERGAFINRTL